MRGTEKATGEPASPGPPEQREDFGPWLRAPSEPDHLLADRMVKGERRAWQAFYSQHLDWLYRFVCYQVEENREDAEDVTSEIMLAAVNSIERYDGRVGSLEAWLRGIARNHIAQFWRRKRVESRAAALPSLSPEEIEGLAGAAESHNPFAKESALAAKSHVAATLALLPSRYAELLREKYVVGREVKEIARRSGASTKAIESALARAREAFRLTFERLSSIPEKNPRRGD